MSGKHDELALKNQTRFGLRLDASGILWQSPVMDSDEREIFSFLKTTGKEFVNAREVCRRAAGKKRYHQDADWAKPILQSMAERGILETDGTGRYRIKPKPKRSGGRWISPDIEKLLKDKGVPVESKTGGELADDEHYEQL
jgi:hypothetical protein